MPPFGLMTKIGLGIGGILTFVLPRSTAFYWFSRASLAYGGIFAMVVASLALFPNEEGARGKSGLRQLFLVSAIVVIPISVSAMGSYTVCSSFFTPPYLQ